MPLNPHPARSANQTNSSHEAPSSRWQHIAHSPTWMVLIGFTLRVLYIAIAHSYKFRTTDANFSFGWEIGRIAYSLASGRGFGSPFGGDTGPSAWTAPVYPWIVSLAFRAFGTYSHAASFALLTLNSLCSALTAWAIYRTARKVFNEKVALWSGWIWALLPYIIYWSVRQIWETSLTALLLSLAFMLTVEMEGDSRITSWIGLGVLWGVIGLTNPSTLSFLPFAGCWLAYQLYRRGKTFVFPAIVAAILFWMTMMPWLVRNYEVFHKPVFVRDNVGVELHCGNNPLAEGIWVGMYHPSQNPILYRRYQEMGESAYSAEQSRLAKQWIAENPKQFAIITFRKFVFFWNGLPRLSKIQALEQFKNSLFLASSLLAIAGLVLAIRNRVHCVFLFASLLIFYPLVYYVSFPQPRYRHPIDPELVILGVYLFTQVSPRNPSLKGAAQPRHAD